MRKREAPKASESRSELAAASESRSVLAVARAQAVVSEFANEDVADHARRRAAIATVYNFIRSLASTLPQLARHAAAPATSPRKERCCKRAGALGALRLIHELLLRSRLVKFRAGNVEYRYMWSTSYYVTNNKYPHGERRA